MIFRRWGHRLRQLLVCPILQLERFATTFVVQQFVLLGEQLLAQIALTVDHSRRHVFLQLLVQYRHFWLLRSSLYRLLGFLFELH